MQNPPPIMNSLIIMQFKKIEKRLLKLLILCLFLSAPGLKSQTINPVQFDSEISRLNDQQLYEASILIIDQVLNDPHASPFDRAVAFIQKSFTYKRVFNYSLALENLKAAEIEALKSSFHQQEILAQIQAERLFIYFDLEHYDKVEEHLKNFDDDLISYLYNETKAFYYVILAVNAGKKEDYPLAEKYFDLAIKILENGNPKHLPNIYRHKILLYAKTGDEEAAKNAFEKGMFYAQDYKVVFYEIILYDALAHYYGEIGDYKNAYLTQLDVNKRQAVYDANNRSTVLMSLENKFEEQRKTIELENEKKRQFYLIIVIFLLVILSFILYRLLKINNSKKQIIEKENVYIRQEVERLTTQMDQWLHEKTNLEDFDLSERQLEVIHLVQLGKTNKEIGEELFISENTVKYHLRTIFQILHLENRKQLDNFN